jgi:hypothetical protein
VVELGPTGFLLATVLRGSAVDAGRRDWSGKFIFRFLLDRAALKLYSIGKSGILRYIVIYIFTLRVYLPDLKKTPFQNHVVQCGTCP